MEEGQWTERLGNGSTVSIELLDESDQRSLYCLDARLDTSTEVGIITPGTAELIESNRSNGTLSLTIAVPLESLVERVLLEVGTRRELIYLPSVSLLDFIDSIRVDREGQGSEILTEIDSPVRFLIVCGSFLDIQHAISFLESAVERSEFWTSQIHSYRYAILRAGVKEGPGLEVRSESELMELIEGLDAIAQIGDIDLIDALGDVMATVHDTPDDTDALLESLDFDIDSLERRDDGFLLVCYLAFHLVSEGLEAAEGYAMERRWRTRGNYKRRVIEAQNADVANRGSSWRSLVCAAARHGREEFAYILANACYWSAHTRVTDSRVTELLYRGAIEAANEIGLDAVERRARFGLHFDIAHRLRSCRNFEPALLHFGKAEELANQYRALPSWRARYARGICESHALFDRGEREASIECLDETIAELPKFDIEDEQLTHATHHLRAQKHERLGDSEPDPEQSLEHYETATERYEIIGFDRSVRRCTRKLERQRDRIDEPDDERAQSPESSPAQPSTPRDQTVSRDTATTPVSEPLPLELWAAETGQYPARRDVDEIPESEQGSLGSRNLDPPQRKDESEDLDDPYMF